MKTYEAYKESGVDWIGNIPKYWSLIPLKYSDETTMGQSPNSNDYILEKIHDAIPFLQGNAEFGKLYPKARLWCNESNKHSKVNDILISVRAPIGAINLSDKVYGIGRGLSAVRGIKHYYKYLYYYLHSANEYLNVQGTGSTFTAISTSVLKELQIPNISIGEQTQIANYLDHKTQIIDALIEKKEQLIKKLQAQRQAIINEAVTKGLNPNAKMKDSGIEWLGEIPEHWEVKRTKYLLNEKDGIKIGPFGSALKLDTLVEKGIKIYGQGNVIKDDFKLGHRYLPLERFEESFQQYEILDGDILVTMMGTTGKSKVFSSNYERGILDSHLLRLRFDENLFNGYLFSIILQQADYIFQQINFNSVGSIMAGLNSAIIKKIKIITPPLNEQLEILEFINLQSSEIDLVISKSKTQIKKLKSYRQSIISEAVTGKIDVRDWQVTSNN